MTTATVERVSLSVNEAAAALGVGRDLVFRALNSGTLKSFRIGGRRLILVDDLKDYAQRQAADGGE
ncbi:MAG: helix-turn-helix domain-containing protein [Chloroflexi bacterium]|nr:MAG: helix-turn-helix domain-containing protein [Chloroflexota bacterium]